jgi:hypothetical protein
VEETPPGKPLDITAFIPEESGWQVTLYYRAAGEERFDSTLMKPRYNELVGRIPASKTAGASLQYYIEVRDKTGKIIERSARSASPNLVFVDPDAQPRYYPDLENEIQIEQTTQADPLQTGDGTAGTPTPGGDGSFSDVDSNKFQYAKWGATGATVVMASLWLTFNRSAANMAVSIEDEATRSTMTDDCPSQAPCRSFSEFQKELERRGQRYQTLSYVSLGLGLASAGVAGYLWYREIDTKQRRKRASAISKDTADTNVTAVPVVGPDFVGGAAHWNF